MAGILLVLLILALMLGLLYCFHHEERLISLFQQYVVQGCLERQKTTSRIKENFKQIGAWLTKVQRYREQAKPKMQTITIRFENLSLLLKKVKLLREPEEGGYIQIKF